MTLPVLVTVAATSLPSTASLTLEVAMVALPSSIVASMLALGTVSLLLIAGETHAMAAGTPAVAAR